MEDYDYKKFIELKDLLYTASERKLLDQSTRKLRDYFINILKTKVYHKSFGKGIKNDIFYR